MTIASAVSRVDYTGNGATSVYSYTFKIFQDADVLVTVRNTDGVETTLTLTTDYTVSGEGDAGGGSITLVNASQAWLTSGKLTTGYILSIRRVIDVTQESDIRNQGDFYPEGHENQFDKCIMIDQQQQDEIDRSMKLPETIDPADFSTSLPSDIIDTDSAGKSVVVNADADGFELSASSTAGADALFMRDVVYITFANTPYTLTSDHRGKLISVDTSGGAVTVNLPAISGLDLTEAFSVAVRKQTSDANAVTVAPNGSETINKVAASTTLVVQSNAILFVPDKELTPDDWQTLEFRRVAVSGSVVGTSDTQTLSNKTFSDPVTIAEVATPSTPSSGFGKIYPKSDGKWYVLNDDGTETQLGAGSGGINYISANPDAESSTTGWTLYDDAASAPVDGNGGTLTTTLTRTTSSPLRGTGSFLLTTTAANLQGEGVAFDFTISNADLAKVLAISFDYTIASGTYATGDYTVYIIQDPSGTPVVIQPAPYQIQNLTVGLPGKFQATFQTSSTVTTYRLVIHRAVTTSSACTFKFDNVIVGPQIVQYGAPIGDWASYTPSSTQGFGTVSSSAFFYRRVGDSIEISGSFTSGTVTASEARISLPTGMTIDSTKFSGTRIIGISSRGSAMASSQRVISTGANAYVNFGLSDGSYSAQTAQAGNSICGNSEAYRFHCVVPVLGFSSTVQMSNDTDTRAVAACYVGGTTSIAASTQATVIPSTKEWDTHNAYATGTGLYTVPVSGKYKVSAMWEFASVTWGNGTYAQLFAVQTGSTSVTKRLDRIFTSPAKTAAGSVSVQGSSEFDCVAGDVLKIQAYQDYDGASALAGTGTGSTCYVQFERLSGPSAIASTESVMCSYSSNSGQSMVAGADTTIVFEDLVYDTHGAYNASTGAFTAPVSGKYRVNAAIVITSVAWTAGNIARLAVAFSTPTNIIKQTLFTAEASVSMNVQLMVDHTLKLLAGEIVYIHGTHNRSGGDCNVINSTQFNYVQVERIGNY